MLATLHSYGDDTRTWMFDVRTLKIIDSFNNETDARIWAARNGCVILTRKQELAWHEIMAAESNAALNAGLQPWPQHDTGYDPTERPFVGDEVLT